MKPIISVIHNSGVSIESYFEDLEAQFAAASDKGLSPAASAGLVQDFADAIEAVRYFQVNGQHGLLLAPVLGLDFCAGILVGRNAFQVVRVESIVSLEFKDIAVIEASESEPQFSKPLTKIASDATEFLSGLLQTPKRVRVEFLHDQAQSFIGWLNRLNFSLLMIEIEENTQTDDLLSRRYSPIAVPVQAVSSITFLTD